MRCDPKTKMQNGKNPQQNDWQFSTILGSAFLAIFVFGQAFFIFYQSKDVLVTIWLMTSSFTNSTRFLLTIIRSRFLKILQLFKWMAQDPHHDTHISYLDYTT
jgi:hypothetical protein